jgi:hypothetical protein
VFLINIKIHSPLVFFSAASQLRLFTVCFSGYLIILYQLLELLASNASVKAIMNGESPFGYTDQNSEWSDTIKHTKGLSHHFLTEKLL